MQFIKYYYRKKEKLKFYDLNEKLQDIQTKFEDIYFQTYYPLLTVAYLPNNEIIIDTKNDTFENHVNDFFEYAKCNKDQFPTLFAMARDFLFIPATSIVSEQAFSCAGHIIDKSHTLLDSDIVTALICQRNWLEVSEKFSWDL
ncbi:19242_t:CDS:2 [Cetraspora pellucida]|uniref:19242_t:CDS:1 n=1 Tax=Cetraspora pellucida TaxID=1433469 RepID=A0A9N9J1Z6_9GLOM|nr:19242_t:CDS:2 [Cetraspora pellucida]